MNMTLWEEARKTEVYQHLTKRSDKIPEINRVAEIYWQKYNNWHKECQEAMDLHPLPTYDEVETLTAEEFDQKIQIRHHYVNLWSISGQLEHAVWRFQYCRRRSQKMESDLIHAIMDVIEAGYGDLFYTL